MPDAAEPASLADGQSLAGGIAKLLRDEMAASHLKAVIVRVTRGNRVITTQAFGSSMPGVPATTHSGFVGLILVGFFQHEAYVHARVARVKCPENGVQLVEVSAARPGGGFTPLLDDMLVGDGGICRDLLGTGVTGVRGLLARLS